MHNQSTFDFSEAASSRRHTLALVRAIRDKEEDHEWYPTTQEILATVKSDMDAVRAECRKDSDFSVLDCGAGDGRSLQFLTKGKRYAIEKSRTLVQAMDRSIFVIGADFHQQVLVDKSPEIVFCNPPYSEFEQWATRIIRETRAAIVYLVIPERWARSREIDSAIKCRSGIASVLGSFDFEGADRKARAKVNIVKVQLTKLFARYSARIESDTDPFSIWFDSHFDIKTSRKTDHCAKQSPGPSKAALKGSLVAGSDLVTALSQMYERDLDNLVQNYKRLEELDADLLDELGVSLLGVKEGLREKIKGLKYAYWMELFNNLKTITDRLTTKTRALMLDKLTQHTDVDFNEQNAYAICIWVAKNANHYFDDQLVDFVERLVGEANIKLYKSNEKTFQKEQWRYCRKPEDLDRYLLDYRIVLDRVGGLMNSEWDHENRRYNGLSERAYELLQDMQTIASNLGYDCTDEASPSGMEYWESNKAQEFECADMRNRDKITLASVKAFKNGNLHLKFNQAFIQKLNVEFGRLKGWVKCANEAASEMGLPVQVAEECFGSNLSLECSSDAVMRLASLPPCGHRQ